MEIPRLLTEEASLALCTCPVVSSATGNPTLKSLEGQMCPSFSLLLADTRKSSLGC
jgi:hypothetical protein